MQITNWGLWLHSLVAPRGPADICLLFAQVCSRLVRQPCTKPFCTSSVQRKLLLVQSPFCTSREQAFRCGRSLFEACSEFFVMEFSLDEIQYMFTYTFIWPPRAILSYCIILSQVAMVPFPFPFAQMVSLLLALLYSNLAHSHWLIEEPTVKPGVKTSPGIGNYTRVEMLRL